MVGEHALTGRVTAWMMATQARLGMTGQARAVLAALDDRQAAVGEIRNAAAVICLAEQDPASARRELRPVLDGSAAVHSYLTQVEAHLLDALACRDLGDKRASREAVERALSLAEADRLVLPFAMTGAWELPEALPSQGTSRTALVAGILGPIRGGATAQPTPKLAEELSASELRVLRYLPTNLTRPEIAAELSVSLNTVSTHIRRIYAKLGAADRSSAVQRGRELRLLSATALERRTIICRLAGAEGDRLPGHNVPAADLLNGAKVYVLAAIEHGTRRVRFLGATEHPVESWVIQQARNLVMDLEDAGTRVKFVLHDRDASFTTALDEVFRAAGTRIIRSAVQAPR
jgi:DNA-binding NarL/FixJ family response regulator